MGEFLDQQIQRRILALLLQHSGLHLSKIAELLNKPITVVDSYLQDLEKKNIVTSVMKDGYKRYYCEKNAGKDSDNILWAARQQIYDLILKNPGLHQAKIAHLLSMRKSLAEYHLNFLENDGTVFSFYEVGYKRYYAVESGVPPEDQRIFSMVRQEIPFRIVTLLLHRPLLQHQEIVDHLRVPPSTLSYHLQKLVEQGVVEACRFGDEKGYALKDRKKLLRFLVRYEMQSAVQGLKDLWDDFD